MLFMFVYLYKMQAFIFIYYCTPCANNTLPSTRVSEIIDLSEFSSSAVPLQAREQGFGKFNFTAVWGIPRFF